MAYGLVAEAVGAFEGLVCLWACISTVVDGTACARVIYRFAVRGIVSKTLALEASSRGGDCLPSHYVLPFYV